ncbi:MAG: hypothetical protein C7B45_01660 [Sulfobacillus acidophilus]|uniref:ABC transporter domain-containing protein n=1 Tax=Sulfobacillus acidophilus TaxID=53633 RepID=A0A2T2WNC7_9FIRM|nr:MAG: hypothetical protein C7B45_01660 [Sulfobacillus acidophilus]
MFSALHSVTARSLGVVIVSHRIDEILSITQRVTVLREGDFVGLLSTDETSQTELVEWIVGSRIATIYPALSDKRDTNMHLQIEDLQGPGIGPVTFKARRGEILGLTGLLGPGFARFPEAFNSDVGVFRGRVMIDGRTISPQSRIGCRSGRSARKRGGHDINSGRHVSLPRVSEFVRRGFRRSFCECQNVQEALQELLVRPPRGDLAMSRLSGGNQQKAVLAKWVKSAPLVLVLHEPTQGVDVGAKRDIFYLLKALADKGTTLVLVSNEHEDLAHLSNRVLVFHGLRTARNMGLCRNVKLWSRVMLSMFFNLYLAYRNFK